MTSVLDCHNIVELIRPSINFYAFIDSPEVCDRMQDQRIVDGISSQIFFSERDVEPSQSDAQKIRTIPEPGQSVELNIQFTQLQILLIRFACNEIHFRENVYFVEVNLITRESDEENLQ